MSTVHQLILIMKTYVAHFDGACWPNPNGHAACGAYVEDDQGHRVFEHYEYIGDKETSNNVAEYCGLIAILKWLVGEDSCRILIHGDADLVIKQMTGVWKAGRLTKKERNGRVPIKPRYYLRYHDEAKERIKNLSRHEINFKWIPREQNIDADFLSTKPLVERGYRNTYERF